jgi:hypothetical protein
MPVPIAAAPATAPPMKRRLPDAMRKDCDLPPGSSLAVT